MKISNNLKQALDSIFTQYGALDNKLSWYAMKRRLRSMGVTQRLNSLYKAGVLQHYKEGTLVVVKYFPDRVEVGDEKFNVSFGIEFEGNVCSNKGIVRQSPNVHAIVDNKWDRQYDGTAEFEISSKPFININEFSKENDKQWLYWMEANSGRAPFFKCNYYHNSIGHHIHIGLSDRRLTVVEKKKIASQALSILPFLIFISSNNDGVSRGNYYISKRINSSHFCEWLSTNPIASSHYSEISDSSHGTVEFRMFDSNFPQVDLVLMTILQKVAENTLNGKLEVSNNVSDYVKEKREILKGDLNGYTVKKYVDRLLSITGDLDFSKYPNSFKEILYLACINCTNSNQLVPSYGFKPSQVMVKNSREFLKNLQGLYQSGKFKKLVDNLLVEVESIKKLSDIAGRKVKLIDSQKIADTILYGLNAGKTLEDIDKDMNEIFEVDSKLYLKVRSLLTGERSKVLNVRKDVVNGLLQYKKGESNELIIVISRIKEVPTRTVEEVATEVAQVIGASTKEVLESPIRYYVGLIQNKIYGVVGILVERRTIEVTKFIGEEDNARKVKEAMAAFIKDKFGVDIECVE